jgi:hypothetical protein
MGAGGRNGPRSRTSHSADPVQYHHHQKQQQQQQQQNEQEQPYNTQYNYIRIFECMSCTSVPAALNSSSNDNKNDEISFGILLLSDEASRLFQDAIAGNVVARLRV